MALSTLQNYQQQQEQEGLSGGTQFLKPTRQPQSYSQSGTGYGVENPYAQRQYTPAMLNTPTPSIRQADMATQATTAGRQVNQNNFVTGTSVFGDKPDPQKLGLTTDKTNDTSFDWGGAVKQIGGQIGTTLANDAKVKSQEAWKTYHATLDQAKSDGKFWFDPNTDLPSFEDYITNYPSQIQTLINGEQLTGDAADVGRWLDPALAIVGEISGDRKKWDYVQNEALQGAEEGIGGGWQQMTINSILGAVQGFFGYEDAMAADAEQMRKLRKEYADKTKKWNIARKQQAKVRAYNARMSDKTKRETAAATAKAEKEAAIVKRQQKMASTLKTLSTNRLRPQSAIAG